MYAKASTCPHNIYITNGVSFPCTVPKLDSSVAKEILGVWQAPDGSQQAQLQKLLNLVSEYTSLLHNSFLNSRNVLTSFWQVLWSSIQYLLVAMSITHAESQSIMTPLYKSLLPKVGVLATLTLAY